MCEKELSLTSKILKLREEKKSYGIVESIETIGSLWKKGVCYFMPVEFDKSITVKIKQQYIKKKRSMGEKESYVVAKSIEQVSS